MTEVECHHCEYDWEYSGGMAMATCPSCSRKTSVDGDE